MPWVRSTQLGRTQAHLLHTSIYSSRVHTHTHTSAVVDSVIIALASSQRRQHHVRSTSSSLSSNASTCMSPPPLPPPTAACSADTDPSEPPAPPPPRPRALRAPGTTQTTCTNRIGGFVVNRIVLTGRSSRVCLVLAKPDRSLLRTVDTKLVGKKEERK
jgi:hypothetical protein